MHTPVGISPGSQYSSPASPQLYEVQAEGVTTDGSRRATKLYLFAVGLLRAAVPVIEQAKEQKIRIKLFDADIHDVHVVKDELLQSGVPSLNRLMIIDKGLQAFRQNLNWERERIKLISDLRTVPKPKSGPLIDQLTTFQKTREHDESFEEEYSGYQGCRQLTNDRKANLKFWLKFVKIRINCYKHMEESLGKMLEAGGGRRSLATKEDIATIVLRDLSSFSEISIATSLKEAEKQGLRWASDMIATAEERVQSNLKDLENYLDSVEASNLLSRLEDLESPYFTKVGPGWQLAHVPEVDKVLSDFEKFRISTGKIYRAFPANLVKHVAHEPQIMKERRQRRGVSTSFHF
ncbi:hypothetical protein T439DRAFT_128541 [Meredithblackwellia eburnea MCA 4105]